PSGDSDLRDAPVPTPGPLSAAPASCALRRRTRPFTHRVTAATALVHCSSVVSVLSTMVAGAGAVLLGHSAPEGFWIRHTPRTSEHLEVLAERFDVTEAEIRAWNGLDADDPLPRGKSLRIRARATPPPLQLQRVLLVEPTRWEEAARTFEVDEAQLRAWNPRYRGYETRLPKRALLSLWRESGVTRYPMPAFDAPLPDIEPIPGGRSEEHTPELQ